jgi:hypothetical protein
MNRSVKLAGAAVFVLATASSAIGDTPGRLAGAATYTIELRGYVPVVCRVSMDQTLIQPIDKHAQIPLGTLHEFCNSPNGYEVWVDHAPGLQTAAFYVDGKRVPFSPHGSTLVSDSRNAAIRNHELALDTGKNGAEPASLSLRIVAR